MGLVDDGQCQRIYEERPAGELSGMAVGFTGTSIAVVPSLNLSVILLINRQNTGLLLRANISTPTPYASRFSRLFWIIANSHLLGRTAKSLSPVQVGPHDC